MTENRKIALVTGSNRGLGLEVSRQLAKKKFLVFLGCRDFKKGLLASQQLEKEQLQTVPLQIDVTDKSSVTNAMNEISSHYGRIDALINNAGGNYDYGVTPLQTDFNFFNETINLNLLSVWRVTLAALPLLRKGLSPRIVNVSSGAGSFSDRGFGIASNPGVTSYSISKLALNALTVKLSLELKNTPILINSVCPGFTATQPGMREMGARPVEQGAASIVWGTLISDDGPSGGFFRDGQPIGW